MQPLGKETIRRSEGQGQSAQSHLMGPSSTFTNWASQFRTYKESLSKIYPSDLFYNAKFFYLLKKLLFGRMCTLGGLQE